MVVAGGVSEAQMLLNWLWFAPYTHNSVFNSPSDTVGLARLTACARL